MSSGKPILPARKESLEMQMSTLVHVGICATNLEASLRFWRDALGLEAYVPPSSPGADSLYIDAKKIPIEMAGKLDPNLHPALAQDEPAATDSAKPTK